MNYELVAGALNLAPPVSLAFDMIPGRGIAV